jgi:hypothetical protein
MHDIVVIQRKVLWERRIRQIDKEISKSDSRTDKDELLEERIQIVESLAELRREIKERASCP